MDINALFIEYGQKNQKESFHWHGLDVSSSYITFIGWNVAKKVALDDNEMIYASHQQSSSFLPRKFAFFRGYNF